MPIYTFHINSSESYNSTTLARQIAALHAHVRIEFISTVRVESISTHGGVGWKPSKHWYEPHQTTSYLVAQIPFAGTASDWKEYCDKILAIFGRGLRSIYLRKVDFEFEVKEVGRGGRVIDVPS